MFVFCDIRRWKVSSSRRQYWTFWRIISRLWWHLLRKLPFSMPKHWKIVWQSQRAIHRRAYRRIRLRSDPDGWHMLNGKCCHRNEVLAAVIAMACRVTQRRCSMRLKRWAKDFVSLANKLQPVCREQLAQIYRHRRQRLPATVAYLKRSNCNRASSPFWI